MYVKAQKILQTQLLEKQNHLQNLIQDQKTQLVRIQEQIILNAQAHFSLHEVDELESTKQLQQRVYELELERKEHEARQKDLRKLFLEKLSGLSDCKNSADVQCTKISNSHAQYSGSMRLQSYKYAANTASSSGQENASSNYPDLGIAQKTPEESSCGSREFVNKRSEVNRQAISSHGFDDDLFSGVLAGDRGQSSSKFYTQESQSRNPQYTFSSSQSKSNDFSFSDRHKSTRTASSANQAKDYFSKFSTSELETFLSCSSFPSSTAAQPDATDELDKEEKTTPSSYDSLLLQQKRLLEMQEVRDINNVRAPEPCNL